MKRIILLKSRIQANGGAEKYARRLAVAFQEKNCDVALITSGPVPKESICEMISDETLSPFSFRRIQKFDRFCSKVLDVLEPDVIFSLDRNRRQTHIRASGGVHAAYLEHRRKESSFFKNLSFQINPLHRTLLNIEKSGFEDPSLKKLFVNSSMVRKEIIRFYNTDPNKICVLHNGVEWEEMQQDFDLWEDLKPQVAKKLQLNPSTFHFLFIGHNYRRKGLEILLRALSKIAREDFHLSVVGKEKNLASFKALVKALHLGNKVSFFPEQKEIRPFYQLADALVIPSTYDPFANVTVEALAMGVYTISSKTNGGKEVLTPDSGSIIEDLYEIDAVVNALKKALSCPKTKNQACSIRESVKHLDFGTQLMRYVDESLN
ncbi:MAG: glycosyltransferase family 4 protein [Chlamydiota bacterium]